MFACIGLQTQADIQGTIKFHQRVAVISLSLGKENAGCEAAP